MRRDEVEAAELLALGDGRDGLLIISLDLKKREITYDGHCDVDCVVGERVMLRVGCDLSRGELSLLRQPSSSARTGQRRGARLPSPTLT